MAESFPYLFSPLRIGKREVKNRIVFQAHQTVYRFGEDNNSGERYIAYQEARARGGAGVIVLENTPPHASTDWIGHGVPSPELMRAKLRKMADTLHPYGTTVLLQIGHLGREMTIKAGRHALWGFSPLPSPAGGDVPKEMTIEEIRQVIDAFARMATLAREAGLDGVELMGTHGYLIQQSWSPFANQRSDAYGIRPDGELRFANELMAAVRQAIGPGLLLSMRISGDDWMEGGLGTEEMVEIGRRLWATGLLDCFNVVAGAHKNHYPFSVGSTYIPPAPLVPLAAAFRQGIPEAPVWTASRIKDPALAEEILARGEADMIGMTRALIADPDLPAKAQAGRVDEIRECLSCSQGCIDRMFLWLPITCTQNPAAGEEFKGGPVPAERRKRVLVVGGGPAGMEAARVAALRGHDVTLCEAEDALGGQLRLAVRAPLRAELDGVARYRQFELGKLGVRVRVNTRVDADEVRQMRPDVVVVATGARPHRPQLPGIDRSNVFTTWDVLSGRELPGHRIVLIDLQGEQESTSVADYLLEHGQSVEIVTPLVTVGANLGFSHLEVVQQRLLARGAKFTPHTSVESIGDGHLDVCRSYWNSDRWRIEGVDGVVVAAGYRPVNTLFKELSDLVPEVHLVGDAASPRRALEAVAEGYQVGRRI